MSKLLRIFALGGNEVATTALDPKSGEPAILDISSQWRRAATTCEILARIIKENRSDLYVVTHSNGPQVGNVLVG
jgi:carbamate kinase